jgi:penicillin-binding protein 2
MLLSPRRELGEFKKRYKWMALFAVSIFAIIVGRLVKLQLVDGDEWRAIARENVTKTLLRPATRGVIRDAGGRVIADNRPSYNVYITPQLVRTRESIDQVAALMALTPEQKADFEARLAAIPQRRRTHQVEMFTDVTRDQLASLETHEDELRGVDVIATPVRHYAYGDLGAHAVGYLNEVSAEDLERLEGQDYRAGDRIGRSGIERSLESVLRGQSGHRRLVVNARGRRDERLDELVDVRAEVREPIPGRDVVLTLDMNLMRIVQRAFRGHPSGAAVVVDVRTGRIRAMYSKPAYDLNEVTGRLSTARYQEMTNDPFRPLIDKTIYESYFPGSTFKPFTALAALNDGVIDAAQRFECIGYHKIGSQRMRCTAAHGEVDLRMALIQSCNVYFWRVAELVGLERLTRYARDFGLGERTGIGINSEARGFLATREWYEEHFGRFRVGYTLNTAIGQGNTRLTLLQLTLAYAAMANGGTLYAPQLIERIEAPDGTIIEDMEPRARRRISVTTEQLDWMRPVLEGVVNHESGTAFGARIEGGVSIAGKTGTAEVTTRGSRPGTTARNAWYFNRSHGWFAGFAPADDPEVAISIIVEHGGAGGRTAAPIAIQILEEYLSSRAEAPVALQGAP